MVEPGAPWIFEPGESIMHAGKDVRLKCRLNGLGCTNAECVVPCIEMTKEQGDLSEQRNQSV